MVNYNSVETNVIAPFPKNNKYLSSDLSSKINDFQVLCINNPKLKLDENASVNTLNKNIANMSVVQNNNNSNTFIIWEQNYQENKELFKNLRLLARNDLILRMGEHIVGYLLKKYEEHLGVPITNHSKLMDKSFIDHLIQKFDNILKRDTFLSDNIVWEEFCKWFRVHLTDWILEDMGSSIGISRMEKLDKDELNKLFYKFLTENISGNIKFIENFTKIVNDYIQSWIEKVISSMGIDEISIQELMKLLDIKDDILLDNNTKLVEKKNITFTLIDQGNIRVMSNAPYQSVREALSQKSFKNLDYSSWPTVELNKGTIEGTVQIIPFYINEQGLLNDHILVQRAWSQVKELSELDVDIFDALCSFFLEKSRHHKDVVEIFLDDFLSIRGLKQKLGGNGRRGGYEIEQREQVLKALSRIQSVWIDLKKATIYKKGKPLQMKLQGRAFIFKNKNGDEYYIEEQSLEKKFTFTVGEVFAQYLFGSGRQIALLPIQALQYNPYRQKWEKKIIRYLSWRWRTQARKGDFLQPHKISTLLDMIGEKMNDRIPSRTRDRLEQAFDTLLEDGVIASWCYEKWDERIASNNGWARIWANSTILIEPPAFIKEHYSSIEKKQKSQSKSTVKTKSTNIQEDLENIGEKMRTIRKKIGFTLLQVSEELDISVSYLSNIEREIKLPSKKIQARVTNWLELHEFN